MSRRAPVSSRLTVDAVIPARAATSATVSPRSKRAWRSRVLTRSSIAILAMRLADEGPAANLDRMKIDVAGGHINAVVEGAGPLVLLVHGFPEGAWAWRHQLPALAAAGYRAVAIDVRGYGDSFVPDKVEAYRMLAHVADNVAVVRGLGADTAVVVGDDWGSAIATASAQVRPDLFTGVAMLGVPYTPRAEAPPAFPADFYVGHFQTPGVAEAEVTVLVQALSLMSASSKTAWISSLPPSAST